MYHLCADSNEIFIRFVCSKVFAYHITEDKDVRADEIITFLENCFARVVFCLITDTEDCSLMKENENLAQCSMVRTYKAKNPEKHSEPVTDKNNPKPGAKGCRKHCQCQNSWRY